jgi:hypothetical protein
MTGAPTVEHTPEEACRWLLRKPFSLDEVVRMIAAAIASLPPATGEAEK